MKKIKLFIPLIVTTVTAFPALILKHSDGQSQILTGISTGTNRAKEVDMFKI